MKKRIEWIDVAKCFGIFAIYLGHCGGAAGKCYEFVFTHHVPLFFLISGCMENVGHDLPVHKVVAKTVKQITIPWLVYWALSMVVSILFWNDLTQSIQSVLLTVVRGTVRNTFVAGGLWFLTCLMVIKIVFSVIRKTKYKVCVLLICTAMFCVTQLVFDHNPLIQPKWAFNVDSAMYYILYYAVGYVSFPFICKALEPKKIVGKVLLVMSGIVAFGYSGILFFGRNLLSFLADLPYVSIFYPVVTALIVIWLYILAARLCQNVKLFQDIGKNTLHLCGGEYGVNSVFQSLLAMLGLGVNLISPLATFCYVAVVLVLANKYFVPVGKQLVNTVYKIPEYFKKVSSVNE